jgi:hypothetical protein
MSQLRAIPVVLGMPVRVRVGLRDCATVPTWWLT